MLGALQARYNSEMKVKVVVQRLKDDGWGLVRRKGSHRQFKHPSKKGLVTVPGKPSDDLAAGTLSSIFKQAGSK
jgi:predicted RNA binding protein YcfA (HicA-like mRNA interferase family)